MDLRKRMRNWRAGGRAPAPPTVAQMTGNMPGANYAATFDPYSGRVEGNGGYTPASAQVVGNQNGRQAALTALGQMQQRSQTGWSALDRQALDAANRQSGQYEQAQRGANMQNMAARGMRGSGMEMLGAMTAQQGGADRALDAATQVGLAGRQSAQENTANAANLGLGIDTQQFGQGMTNAQNLDAFNQFATGTNMQAQGAVHGYNMDRYNIRMDQRKQGWDRVTGGLEGALTGGLSIAQAIKDK